MSKKTGILAIVLSVIAICLSLFAIVQVRVAADSDTHDIQYVMYLGSNDKDTNEPVFQPGEAKKEAEEILLKHFGGYTIQENQTTTEFYDGK